MTNRGLQLERLIYYRVKDILDGSSTINRGSEVVVGLGCMEQSSHGRIAILLTMGWGDLRVGHNGKRLLTAFNGTEMQESQEWACRRQEIVIQNLSLIALPDRNLKNYGRAIFLRTGPLITLKTAYGSSLRGSESTKVDPKERISPYFDVLVVQLEFDFHPQVFLIVRRTDIFEPPRLVLLKSSEVMTLMSRPKPTAILKLAKALIMDS